LEFKQHTKITETVKPFVWTKHTTLQSWAAFLHPLHHDNAATSIY